MTTTPPADTDQTPAVPRSADPRRRTAGGEPSSSGGRGSGEPARRPAGASAAAAPSSARSTGDTSRTPVTTAPTDGARTGGASTSGGAPKRVMGYRRQRFEARKVRRLIRHVDPWSMLKLAVLVSLCMWLITMIASVILWTVAESSGTISSIENFVNSSLQLQDWKLDGEFLFRQFGLITLLLYLGFAASIVVASLVFNLISDIIGGVWISVIEEETARPVSERPRS